MFFNSLKNSLYQKLQLFASDFLDRKFFSEKKSKIIVFLINKISKFFSANNYDFLLKYHFRESLENREKLRTKFSIFRKNEKMTFTMIIFFQIFYYLFIDKKVGFGKIIGQKLQLFKTAFFGSENGFFDFHFLKKNNLL